MATCTTTQYTDNATCYKMHSLNPAEQKALLIYAMAAELKAVGGTDYTSALGSTLISDAACLFNLNEDERIAALINITFVQAIAAGAAIPATLKAKLTQVACLKTVPLERLEAIILMLRCQLGYATGL